MKEELIEKLRKYIVDNNPEILLSVHVGFSISQYLTDKVDGVMPLVSEFIEAKKPAYIITELVMQQLTEDLRPSKFIYIQNVLEVEFRDSYDQFSEAGVLTYETINMIAACKEIFETFGFSEENEDDRHLRYAIIAEVHDYLLS